MSLAQPIVRLEGLNHLYFEHVGGDKERLAIPQYLAKYLPEVISNTPPEVVAQFDQDGLSQSLEVREFPLVVHGSTSTLSLRQIILGKENQRITELWWALYDSRRRSDVWYFTALPERNDSKMLSNYEIEAVSATAEGLKLQIYGSMFRPQGAWWITGKTFSFAMQDQTLRFSRVLNDFGFFHGYDVGRKPTDLDVSTEHEVSERFQALNYDKVSEPILRACEFHDPLNGDDDDWEFNWTNMERTAICIAKKVKARRASYRNFDQPSFIERGGK